LQTQSDCNDSGLTTAAWADAASIARSISGQSMSPPRISREIVVV
jgi:hypothetical protein